MRVALRGACEVNDVSFPTGTTFLHVGVAGRAQRHALRWTRDGRLDATTSTWGDEVVGEWPSRAYVRYMDGRGPQRAYIGKIGPGGVELVEGFGQCSVDPGLANGLDCSAYTHGVVNLSPWKGGGFLVTAPPFVLAIGGGATPNMRLRSLATIRSNEDALATSAGEIVYVEEQIRSTPVAGKPPRIEVTGTWLEAWTEGELARTMMIPDRVKLFAGLDGRVLVVKHKETHAYVVNGSTLKEETILPVRGAALVALHFTSRGAAWAVDALRVFQRAPGTTVWIDTQAPIDPARLAAGIADSADVSGEIWVRSVSNVFAHRDGQWSPRTLPPEAHGMHPYRIFANGAEVWIPFTDGKGNTVLVTNAQVREPWTCDEAALATATGQRHWTLPPH